ncbi:MAG: hypothetical protein ACYCW6_20760 [Candidatus Xenobia bacterium]
MAEAFKTRIFNTGVTPLSILTTAVTVGPAVFLLRHLVASERFIQHHAEVGALMAAIDGGLACMLLFIWGVACWQNFGKSLRVSVDGIGYYHRDRDFFQVDWKETVVREGLGLVELESPRGKVRLYALFFPQFSAVRHAIAEAQTALKLREHRNIARLVEQAEEASHKI